MTLINRMIPRLISIKASHYTEKVRWALDRAKIDYREEPHAPIFSRLATGRTGKAGSVPVLVTDDGTFRDSTEILRWVDKKLPLFPGDAAAVEERLDVALGAAARDLFYIYIMKDGALARRIALHGVPGWEAALARLAFPVAVKVMFNFYKIGPHTEAEALATLRQVFAEMDARLADGRRYLCGDMLSAADLALAGLSTLILLPPQHEKILASRGEVCAALQKLIDELRATDSGKLILRLYAEERNR